MKYVIGDVHGCNQTLLALIKAIEPKSDVSVYFVGDLIDRGPDSKGVIDTIIKLKADTSISCCRGNHEQLMFDSEKSADDKERWLRNGGDTTLESFGIVTIAEIPLRYMQFFSELHYYFSLPEALIVHAGFNFQDSDFLSDTYHMLWTRDHHFDLARTYNRPVIHGHTPVTKEACLKAIDEKCGDLNIDTGCVYTLKEGMGKLSALRLDDMKLISVDTIDRVRT